MPSAEFERLLQVIRSMPRIDHSTVPIGVLRDGLAMQMAMLPVRGDEAREEARIGDVRAVWTGTPASTGARTVLYLHGGGYCLGSPETHRALVAEIADACGARVLAVDYRLAPESPFPAAVDDAVAAYRWLLEGGADPGSIVVGGDSAGGGLTFAALVALRDAGAPLPAGAFALSPWVDLEGLGDSMTTKAEADPMIGRAGLVRFGRLYLGGADPKTALAAPLYADLAGLPPVLIQVGTAETLLDDSRRIARALERAGTAVTLEEWSDMIHVFQATTFLPESRDAVAKIAAFVRRVAG